MSTGNNQQWWKEPGPHGCTLGRGLLLYHPPRPLGPGVFHCHFSLKHQHKNTRNIFFWGQIPWMTWKSLEVGELDQFLPPLVFALPSAWPSRWLGRDEVWPDSLGQLEAEWAGWCWWGWRRDEQLQPLQSGLEKGLTHKSLQYKCIKVSECWTSNSFTDGFPPQEQTHTQLHMGDRERPFSFFFLFLFLFPFFSFLFPLSSFLFLFPLSLSVSPFSLPLLSWKE